MRHVGAFKTRHDSELPGDHIDDAARNQKGRNAPRTAIKKRLMVIGDHRDAADAGTYRAADAAQELRRVEAARAVQRERFAGEGVRNNANMGERQIKKYCRLSAECEGVLRNAFESLHLSARARSRIIKVARTIADLDFSADIQPRHILEAASYRSFDGNAI